MTEQISALLDDEVGLDDAAHLMEGMQTNGHSGEVWSQYHLIGDVMRGTSALSPGFKKKLMARIDLEPTALSPNAASVNEPRALSDVNELSALRSKKQSFDIKNTLRANNFSAIWSVAASFAAVMAVGWVVLQTQVTYQAAPAMVAKSTLSQDLPTLPVATEQGIPAEYLMAHQASAPSASSYYIQSASYTE